jgi:mevalonate kinase
LTRLQEEALKEATIHLDKTMARIGRIMDTLHRLSKDEDLAKKVESLDNDEQRRIKFSIEDMQEHLQYLDISIPRLDRWLSAIKSDMESGAE